MVSGADPRFPIGVGANCPRGGGQHTNLSNFTKNCIKLRKFLAVEGACAGWGERVHLRSTTGCFSTKKNQPIDSLLTHGLPLLEDTSEPIGGIKLTPFLVLFITNNYRQTYGVPINE